MNRIYTFFSILVLTIVPISTSFAQDNTQVGLPEGAIARLGKGGINIMRFSPDGTRLVVGTDVGVWVYDVLDGKETALFTEHTGQVNALVFSPNGKILASGGFANPIIQLWDLDIGKKLSKITLTQKTDSVVFLAFSQDAKTLISLDIFGEITHWDIETSSKLSESDNVEHFESAAFSTEANIFATGQTDGKISLWDATTGRQRTNLSGHSGLFTGDNFVAGLVTLTFKLPEDQDVRALAFSSDGKMLVSGSLDHTVQLWNVKKRRRLATLKGHEGWVTAVAFSKDGNTIASGDTNKKIKLWDVNTKRERATLTGHRNTISTLTFSPDGTTLASGSYDGTIRFWNANTGREISTFSTEHTESVKAVAFAADGTTLVSAAFNGTVQVWNLKTAREQTSFTAGQCDRTEAVAFSPDAKFFACQRTKGKIVFSPYRSGSLRVNRLPNSIQLWNIATGEKVTGPWNKRIGTVNALALSQDSKILVASKRGGQGIMSWNIDTGIETSHFNRIKLPDIDKGVLFRRLTFSPNNKLILSPKSIGGRYLIQLSDADTNNSLATLSGHTEPIETLVFSHDGKILASGSQDGTVLLWDWDKIISKAKENKGN